MIGIFLSCFGLMVWLINLVEAFVLERPYAVKLIHSAGVALLMAWLIYHVANYWKAMGVLTCYCS